jgi:hypothetical protein
LIDAELGGSKVDDDDGDLVYYYIYIIDMSEPSPGGGATGVAYWRCIPGVFSFVFFFPLLVVSMHGV